MLNLRIRQAETAMADGRLDEACRIAKQSDVRQHRRGQQLVTDLVKLYVQRGHEHFANARYQQASYDASRAAELGGNLIEVTQLRNAITEAIGRIDRAKRTQQLQIRLAESRVEVGELTLGNALCDEITEPEHAVRIRRDIDKKRENVKTHLGRAREAIANSRLDDAITDLLLVKSTHPENPELAELVRTVRDLTCRSIRDHLENGRIDQAALATQRIASLVERPMELDELQRILSQFESARASLRNGSIAEFTEKLGIIRQCLPNASWVDTAFQKANTASSILSELRNGPLGTISLVSTAPPVQRPVRDLPAPQGSPIPPQPRSSSALARPVATEPNGGNRFLLHIDGAGSFGVLRDDVISIGSDAAHDLRLSTPNLPSIQIERVDDDYFLRASTKIRINDREFNSKLLSHNDRIRLGRRCSILFALPCAASSSATLEFQGSRSHHADVKKVVLMDTAIVVASHQASHVHSRPVEKSFALYFREQNLWARKTEGSDKSPIKMEPGTPCEIGGIHVVAKPWRV